MFLYRYLNDKQIAQDFMKFNFRIMPLTHYQDIEHPERRDPDEGITKISVGADDKNIYLDHLADNKKNKSGIPENVDMKIETGNKVSWQWHALCLSTQCNKYLSTKFNSKYVVGFHFNEMVSFLQSEVFWKRILQYRCNYVCYCDDKDFLNKNQIEYYRIASGEVNYGEFYLYRDCFVKKEKFNFEHEYRFLFIIPGNEDDLKPITSPFYFKIARKMQSAILIEF